jgi:DNA repair exonuclease SbcCD ATPase subunit
MAESRASVDPPSGTRRRSRGGEVDDVEAVLDELYGTPPSDFVARRETLAAAARTAGRAEDARRIHGARRPTLAAWAANLLLRSQPEESRQFLELGEALREAYHTLDADGLKDLSAQRRRVVSALSRQAAQMALEAGYRLSESVQQDVEATLRAVLADQDAADRWAAGRLISALTPPSDFRPGTAAPVARSASRGRPAPVKRARAEEDELAEGRRARQERLARAREEAEAAEERLREERARRADADSELQRARERTEEARRRMSAAEEQLRQARQDCRQAETDRQEAEKHSRSAAEALARAERDARERAQYVRRLSADPT